MAQNLPIPPKFGGVGLTNGPKSLNDWLQFARFLFALWEKAKASVSSQTVEGLIPVPIPAPSAAMAIGAASVSAPPTFGARPDPRGAIAAAVESGRFPDKLGNLAGYLLLSNVPSIPSFPTQTNPNPYGVVVQGTHDDRYSVGTGTVAGSVLTATAGPAFRPNWVGHAIAINGSLFNVLVFTDATHITVSGTPPAGAVGWEFMLYPANLTPYGSAFLETDRKVFYRIGDSVGTVNLSHSTVTWVSGPKFSPYWTNTAIVINGITYTLSGATETTGTLTADSGLVSAGLAYTVVASSWFYQGGIESLSSASLLARLSSFTVLDDGYRCDVFDFNHTIIYNGTGAAWAFAIGDSSKYIVPSADGSAPSGGPWQFCDGTTVTVFMVVAGVPQLVNVTAPDMRGDTFIRQGTFTGTADAATAPTFTSALTFSGAPATLTGSVAAPVFSGASATLTGSVAAPVFTGVALGTHQHAVPIGWNGTSGQLQSSYGTTGAGHTGAVAFTVAAGGALFSDLNTSSVSSGTPTGTNNAPALTMNPYTPTGTNNAPALTMNTYTPTGSIAGTGTISSTGTPKSIALLFYMRR